MTDGDATSYLLAPSLPFSSSILGCCGNGRADLKSLSPIVSLKLLNFTAHMTVSQGCVKAWQEKACMRAHVPSVHQDIHSHTQQAHTGGFLKGICDLFSVLTSMFRAFSLLTQGMVRGERRTRGERGQWRGHLKRQ